MFLLNNIYSKQRNLKFGIFDLRGNFLGKIKTSNTDDEDYDKGKVLDSVDQIVKDNKKAKQLEAWLEDTKDVPENVIEQWQEKLNELKNQ